MNEQTNTTKETFPNEETNKEINENSNAEQTKPKESGSTPGEAKPEQVDFSQMYDMLTERDTKLADLTTLVNELKKTNTELLLKVNASSVQGAIKDPYEAFIDSMASR